jgi:hypothetical protein
MSGRLSPQARGLLDELTGVGVERKDVRVRTDPSRDGSGTAMALLRVPTAEQVVIEHAQHLADRGLHVTVIGHTCGHVASPVVSNSPEESNHKVVTVPLPYACKACR